MPVPDLPRLLTIDQYSVSIGRTLQQLGFQCSVDDEKIRTGWPNADTGPETSRFNETLYTTGVIYPFDWSKWHGEVGRLFGDPDALGSADELTLRKGLTYHARADRFNEGHLDEMIAAGHITMILRRIKELQEC